MKTSTPPAPGDRAKWKDEFGKPASGTVAEVLQFGTPGKPPYARVCRTPAEVADKRAGYWLPLCLVSVAN